MKSWLENHNAKRMETYALMPHDLREHYGIEQTVLAGGYGYRQVMELIQNGADAILEFHQNGAPFSGDEQDDLINVLLRDSRLYVANTGAPLSKDGVEALLSSHSSPKRGNQIGRFGLGFKSLLRLGGKIDIFTKMAGAIRFDPERCRRELRERFEVADVPGLRLAWPLADTEHSADSGAEYFPWAETIVRVDICQEEFLEHLRTEIGAFPPEFLLFLPVPARLILDDGVTKAKELRVKPTGTERVLFAGEDQVRWHIISSEVSITDERAITDATHIHARQTVPVAWAMPLDSKRDEAGRFWAFFPTHTPLYLPGILNAPWKLNSDRNAIIAGDWNTALMREAAKLIAAALPGLCTDADPGRPLDAFPRQLDRKDEDAAQLVEALWAALEDAKVVPDADGNLRLARELYRHPRPNADIARQWQSLAGKHELVRMIHPSCLERQRASRLSAFAERLKQQEGQSNLASRSAASWFAAVASTEPDRAIEVLQLAEAYEKDCKAIEWNLVRPVLSIIPTEDGKLVPPGKAVFAPGETHVPAGRCLVSRRLSENEEARRILLDVLKVSPIDASVWETALREALESNLKASPAAQDRGWSEFWAQLRTAPELAQDRFVREQRDQIRIRRMDGSWVPASEALFPGTLISADDETANHKFLIDNNLHGDDTALLRAIGVRDCPEGNVQCKKFIELWDWLCVCRLGYREKYDNSASWDYLVPIGLIMPAGWEFLPQFTGTSNSRLTELILARISRGEFGETVLFRHRTELKYPKLDVTHPLLWFLLKNGTVGFGGRTVALSAIVARLNEPALKMIPLWSQIEGALIKLKGAVPGVGTTKAEISNFWFALFKELAIPRFLSNDSLRALWSGAANDNVVPEILGAEPGQIPLSQVYVTGSSDLALRARGEGYLVVPLDDHALKLWIESGARDLVELISPQFVETTGPSGLLVSTVPEIVDVLREKEKTAARCQPVSGLELIIAGTGYPAPCLVWDNVLLFDAGQMASLSRTDRYRYLLKEISVAGWLENEPEEALRILGGTQMDALRAMVAEGSTLPERLYRAVGKHDEALREALGALASMDFLKECKGLKLAELTLAQLGPATLNTLKNTLTAEGLNPPARWNTAEARAFVASIGFPESFAASPDVRRESEEFISGPIYLPSLHDFQEEVLDGIKALISGGRTRRRAVVSLPTGGGKTRVTVEAAVRLVLRPEGDCRSIIWVAQTDELCEQAVQAFRQVWVNLGAEKTDLRIVRLWGGNPTPAIQELDKPVVVVASIQTLNSRMGTDGLNWLQKPGLVVVDECHHAITPSYTNLLRWLDAEAPKPGEAAKDEPPILGLSATPFRTDDLESQRLARRFDNIWLPSNQEELHLRLRRMGVLAEIDADALESGVGLLPEEIEQLSKLSERWEGIEFENILEAINQRLAGSKQRNERLVDHIKKRNEGSILLFANSVSHADEMSARLNLQGIPAASVSGYTPTAARRYFLERFQKGETRVLCNHSVLSTGFDAPKTDMVLISRAIFSPVRYMQIVGRGLRGEKNGGTPRCRIVTVIDNLGRFQDRHPYHYCQKYFTQ